MTLCVCDNEPKSFQDVIQHLITPLTANFSLAMASKHMGGNDDVASDGVTLLTLVIHHLSYTQENLSYSRV